jgi:hypothetical protein
MAIFLSGKKIVEINSYICQKWTTFSQMRRNNKIQHEKMPGEAYNQ